jgi:hypothetical protein
MPRLTTEESISRARRVHGNKYDYALVEYSGARIPVKIICREHGEFEQKPTHHLGGHGCQTCGRLVVANAKRLNTEQFIAKAKRVLGDKYDYSLVSYETAKLPVKIVCPAHGEFEQKPQDHLSGSGCRKCAVDRRRGGVIQLDEATELLTEIPRHTAERHRFM